VEVPVVQQDGQHILKEKLEYASGRPLFAASSLTDYVCIKVRDAAGCEWYTDIWRGAYGTYKLSYTMESFMSGDWIKDCSKLTPIAVVFEVSNG
jgi:hypothetical protein